MPDKEQPSSKMVTKGDDHTRGSYTPEKSEIPPPPPKTKSKDD